MMRLPHTDRAILDIRKLEEYCLDPAHPRGRHKARVFREVLGIGQRDAAWLKDALLDGLQKADGYEIATDGFGTRWRADIGIARHENRSVVRTIWIVRPDEKVLRFVTCWLL